MIILNGRSYYPDSKELDKYFVELLTPNDLIIFIPAATTKNQETYFEFFKGKMKEYGSFNVTWIDLYKDEWKEIAKLCGIGGRVI